LDFDQQLPDLPLTTPNNNLLESKYTNYQYFVSKKSKYKKLKIKVIKDYQNNTHYLYYNPLEILKEYSQLFFKMFNVEMYYRVTERRG